MTRVSSATHIKPVVSTWGYGIDINNSRYWRSDRYVFDLAGKQREISDRQYLIAQKERGDIYFGTRHQGAFLFMFQAVREGRVAGDETFVHFDMAYHPDNNPIDLGASIRDGRKIDLALRLCRERRKMVEEGVVNESNYVTALKEVFPKMRFEYIHANDAYAGPADWGGMCFDRVSSIFSQERALEQENVASVDLDMFRHCQTAEVERGMMRRLVGLTRNCKLVMLFTSPEWIEVEDAVGYLQSIGGRLLRD